MQKQRHRTIRRAVEVAALAAALLDVAIYAAVVRPFRARAASAEESYHALLFKTLQAEARVARLERLKQSLPQADQDLKTFLRDYVPARRWGYSTGERLVRKLTEKSHVELAGITYKLNTNKHEPLNRLAVQVSVNGAFPDLVNFAHAIETASEMLLVRDFSFAAQEGKGVSLQVDADLYLTP